MATIVVCDFRDRFGPARDQMVRPTCLAFAASDTHAALRGPWTPLSCEYVFFHAQRRAGRPSHKGAVLPAMLETLREDGQPAETGWPYLPALPTDLSTWLPPKSVGPIYRRAGRSGIHAVDEIVRLLDEGQPILALMMLSDAFYSPGPNAVIDAVPGEGPDPARRHAVVAVGHGMHGGNRVILIRNSWGEEWGERGYAWLTEAFLRPRLTRIAMLTEEVNVSPGATAA